jgi:hypothetical protein
MAILAQEIRAQHPNTKITLIHRQPRLLDDRFPKKLSNQLEAILKKQNVDLVLGDEHIQEPDLAIGKQNGMRTIRTKNGKEIQGGSLDRYGAKICWLCSPSADFVFIAIGNTPNTQIIAEADPSALSKDRTINVNEYLQVCQLLPHWCWSAGTHDTFRKQVTSSLFPNKNVFAAGDCANSPGWRGAISADADVASISKNIPALLHGAPLKKHAPGMRAMIVPFGPAAGAGFAAMGPLGDTALPQFMTVMAKGKTLLTEKFFERFQTSTWTPLRRAWII